MAKQTSVLAFTVTHGARRFLPKLVPDARGTAGVWFDWLVILSGADEEQRHHAQKLLQKPDGIQFAFAWAENRGQHHAAKLALEVARAQGYKWLLRIDDDIQFRTKRWLKDMLSRLEELKTLTKDREYRMVATPFVKGLKNPIQPIGDLSKGQDFPCELLERSGGACRLLNVAFFSAYEPWPYDPIGRGDPESIAQYLVTNGGWTVRFPDIRVYHPTTQLENLDDGPARHARRMSLYWPWLGGSASRGPELIETPERS